MSGGWDSHEKDKNMNEGFLLLLHYFVLVFEP